MYIYIYIYIYNEQRKGRKINKNALFYRLVSPRGFFEEGRRQPRSPDVNPCVLSMFHPKIMGSLITRLGTFRYIHNTLTH